MELLVVFLQAQEKNKHFMKKIAPLKEPDYNLKNEQIDP